MEHPAAALDLLVVHHLDRAHVLGADLLDPLGQLNGQVEELGEHVRRDDACVLGRHFCFATRDQPGQRLPGVRPHGGSSSAIFPRVKNRLTTRR
ncbi:hypothetical protein [Amycolatopsis methanolica]|uniref:hypothetical protein n=1 Tax=Amycolatopsis methanolica TaxID=1814 RepID=UPI00036C9905|nr:hypothetical protein [Amycolatopsis methanolica]